MSFSPSKIISGGQTGVDRAALDFAIRHGIPYGGFIPKGRWAEDGRIPEHYHGLIETETSDPAERTRLNVAKCEAVLIVSRGTPDGGTRLTIGLAKQFDKPFIHIDLAQSELFLDDLFHSCSTLVSCKETLIAGPRESKCPGIYDEALGFLESVLAS
jgi:hypothetical protein